MKLIPLLKELSRRKKWVAVGPLFAALVVIGVAKELPASPQFTATKQVLVDSTDSSVPDTSTDMFNLVTRAGVYAQIMTDNNVMDLIGEAAGIPADEIGAAGPANTVGQSATHPATVASPGNYSLALTLPNATQQPIISIAAQASTRGKAIALANGAATGLTEYVNELAKTYTVPTKHRISVRDLGAPTVSSASSGVPKSLLPVIFLLGFAGWCAVVVFATRFVRTWKANDAAISEPLLSQYDTLIMANGSDLGAESASGHSADGDSASGSGANFRDWAEDDGQASTEDDVSAFASDLFLSRNTD